MFSCWKFGRSVGRLSGRRVVKHGGVEVAAVVDVVESWTGEERWKEKTIAGIVEEAGHLIHSSVALRVGHKFGV